MAKGAIKGASRRIAVEHLTRAAEPKRHILAVRVGAENLNQASVNEVNMIDGAILGEHRFPRGIGDGGSSRDQRSPRGRASSRTLLVLLLPRHHHGRRPGSRHDHLLDRIVASGSEPEQTYL